MTPLGLGWFRKTPESDSLIPIPNFEKPESTPESTPSTMSPDCQKTGLKQTKTKKLHLYQPFFAQPCTCLRSIWTNHSSLKKKGAKSKYIILKNNNYLAQRSTKNNNNNNESGVDSGQAGVDSFLSPAKSPKIIGWVRVRLGISSTLDGLDQVTTNSPTQQISSSTNFERGLSGDWVISEVNLVKKKTKRNNVSVEIQRSD